MPIIPPVLRGRTPDLPDVPPLVQYLIGAFLEPILAWLKPVLQPAPVMTETLPREQLQNRQRMSGVLAGARPLNQRQSA